MRLIATLLLVQLFSISYSQKICRTPITKVGCISYSMSDFKLDEKCINQAETALYVIDGIPFSDTSGLKALVVNDIESINILKASDMLNIGFCRARRSVILITTKSSNFRKFIIKDFLNNDRVAGATVSFISADKKDTIMTVANDSGVVVTDKLKSTVNYQVSVSAIGYKSLSQSWKNSNNKKVQELMLERDIKFCNEVVLTGFINLKRCIWMGCGGNVRIIETLSNADSAFKFSSKLQFVNTHIFPNPAQRGRSITVQTTAQTDGTIELRIISLDGKLVMFQPQKTIKGLNRFTVSTDSRWSSGIYLVNLYAKGKLLASEKVVIQ